MTLVLEISWSAAASTITVVDTAAHSTVASGSAGHPPSTDGQQDPEAWWGALVRSSEAAIEELAALDLAAADVAMVLVRPGEPVGGLVAVGPSGDVVHPALLGDHAASGADGDWLLSKVDGGESAWRATTGTTPTAGSTVALLSWLHRSAPDAWASAERFTVPTGWIVERLGGDAAISTHDATGTAVLDRAHPDRWCTELLAVVDPDLDWVSALPAVSTAARPVGLLATDAATLLGLPAAVPLHVGEPIPDQ